MKQIIDYTIMAIVWGIILLALSCTSFAGNFDNGMLLREKDRAQKKLHSYLHSDHIEKKMMIVTQEKIVQRDEVREIDLYHESDYLIYRSPTLLVYFDDVQKEASYLYYYVIQ